MWLVSPVLGEPLVLAKSRRYVIGRADTAEVRIRSNSVSREHAQIRWEDDAFKVRDLGSTNGTFVNGWVVRGPVPLLAGDCVVTGGFDLWVKGARPGEMPQEAAGGQTRAMKMPPDLRREAD